VRSVLVEKLGNKKNLLLHYKKVDLGNRYFNDSHTNSWEITEILRVFQLLGWNIELVDRTEKNWVPGRHYDLFISNSSGSSGSNFIKMAEKIPHVYKVMYAAGPAADISDQMVQKRYDDLKLRKNINTTVKALRTFQTDINQIMRHTNSVICIDDNGFSSSTYSRFNKTIYKLTPSSSPMAFDPLQTSLRKKKNKVVLFLGHGFIAKGADIVIDSIMNMPHLELNICGPYKQDEFFWKLYRKHLNSTDNISLHGFVKIGSRKYFKILSEAQWLIHNSAAEGCATAVTTLLRSGIVPITNYETGVDISGLGITIDNKNEDYVSSTKRALEMALDSTSSQVMSFQHKIYASSLKFTRERFTARLLEIAEYLSDQL